MDPSEHFYRWVMAKNNLMVAKNKKNLILVNNAFCHTVCGVPKTMIVVFEAFVLSSITLLFFLANVMSVVQPLDQRVIGDLKLWYKQKSVVWILEHCATTNGTQDLEGTQANLLQCMIRVVAAWNEMEKDTICNAWSVSNTLPWDWNADIYNLQEIVKSQINEEVSQLKKLIASLNLGNIVGRSIEKLHIVDYLDMVDENII